MRGNGTLPAWALVLAAALMLVLLGLAVYTATLPRGAILDDDEVALRHPGVTASERYWRTPFYSTFYRPLWRPLTTLTYWLDWRIGGGTAGGAAGEEGARGSASVRDGMGRANLALALCAAFLALLFLRRIGIGGWPSVATAGLLLMHPAQLESVLSLAGRADLLAVCGMLGALLLYIGRIRPPLACGGGSEDGQKRSSPSWIAWSAWALLAFLALTAKESALLLPFFLLGYELTIGPMAAAQAGTGTTPGSRACFQRPRTLIIAFGILAAVILVWLIARAAVLGALSETFKREPANDYLLALSTGERLRVALYLPAHYLGMLLLFVPLVPGYAYLLARPADAPPVTLGDPSTFGVALPTVAQMLLGIILIGLMALAFVRLRRRAPRAALGLALLGVGILGVLPLMRANGHVASMRHLFLPLLGLLIFLVEGGRAVVARMANPAARRISGSVLVCVLAIVAVGLGLRTHALGKHWTSQERLLDSFAAVAPLSPEVPYQRGIAAVAQRNLVAAASSLEESIALFPRAPRALLTLGLIRAQQGNQSLAGRALSDAAIVADRVMPKSTVALRVHLSVGTLLATQKLNVPALAEFRKAVLADSTNVEALSRAGLLEVLRYETANDGVRHLTRALALDSTGRVLGPAAERLRVFRDRALNNLEFAEGGGPGYEAAMAEVDSALTQPDGTGYEE